MKTLCALTTLTLITLALLGGLTRPAHAGMTCTRIGDFTFCTTSDGRSITCTHIGDMTFCN